MTRQIYATNLSISAFRLKSLAFYNTMTNRADKLEGRQYANYGRKLRQLRLSAKVSQANIAKDINAILNKKATIGSLKPVTEKAYASWEQGHAKPVYGINKALAEYFHVDSDKLYDDEMSDIASNSDSDIETPYHKRRFQRKLTEDDYIDLPVIGTGVRGGIADDVTDLNENTGEYRRVPRSMFDDAEAILPVFGNSMSPGYPPGSEVALARDFSGYFEYGDVYAIKIKNKARPLLKRVEICDEADCILLVSDNEMKRESGPLNGKYFYPPQVLKLEQIDEVWEVIGDCKRRKNKAIILRELRENKNK